MTCPACSTGREPTPAGSRAGGSQPDGKTGDRLIAGAALYLDEGDPPYAPWLQPVGDAPSFAQEHRSTDSRPLILVLYKAEKDRSTIPPARRRTSASGCCDEFLSVYPRGESEFLLVIHRADGGGWVAEFKGFRQQFEFADAAGAVMGEYAKRRKDHEKPAEKLWGDARQAFKDGKQNEEYRICVEIVSK